MSLSQIIKERLSSHFSIYNKKHELIDSKVIQNRFLKIRQYLLQDTKAGEIVALYLNNNENYLLTLLACQQIGRTYIPLRENWPQARVNQIQDLTGFQHLLTDEKIYNILSDDEIEGDLKQDFDINPKSTLYIMFTSGSTGEPKGVVIRRESYMNFLSWLDVFYPEINSNDKLLNSTNYTFDVSLMEVGLFLKKNVKWYCSNVEGNALVVAKELSDLKINISVCVPNVFNLIMSDRIFSELDLSELKYALLAGSKLPPSLHKSFLEKLPMVRLDNLYGPTEGTIYVLAKSMKFDQSEINQNSVSIGKALPNLIALCVDDEHKPLPTGEKGELVVGGIQIMQKYFNRPEKTKEVLFEKDDIVFYKTGDIVFQDKNGEFFVCGRKDDTIKVNGQRVNLTDIDSYVRYLDYITESASVAIPSEVNGYEIHTFVTLSNPDVTKKQIKDDLKKKLLAFQIPKKIHIEKQLPTNSSGKIDKICLKEKLSK